MRQYEVPAWIQCDDRYRRRLQEFGNMYQEIRWTTSQFFNDMQVPVEVVDIYLESMAHAISSAAADALQILEMSTHRDPDSNTDRMYHLGQIYAAEKTIRNLHEALYEGAILRRIPRNDGLVTGSLMATTGMTREQADRLVPGAKDPGPYYDPHQMPWWTWK